MRASDELRHCPSLRGCNALGGEDEPHEKHGTIIADGPKAIAIEGSSVEENVGIDPGRVRPAAPTHEQIARRAYELYLERDEKPGHEREDWATAEKELSEKSGDDRMA